jgi:hypothetical protein
MSTDPTSASHRSPPPFPDCCDPRGGMGPLSVSGFVLKRLAWEHDNRLTRHDHSCLKNSDLGVCACVTAPCGPVETTSRLFYGVFCFLPSVACVLYNRCCFESTTIALASTKHSCNASCNPCCCFPCKLMCSETSLYEP